MGGTRNLPVLLLLVVVGAPAASAAHLLQSAQECKIAEQEQSTFRGRCAERESAQDETVDLRDETLFATNVALPANLTEGEYRTRMFLLRDREVVNISETQITVRKEGLARWIYTTAHERPLLYGILSIAVALFAGWLASEIFRLLRR